MKIKENIIYINLFLIIQDIKDYDNEESPMKREYIKKHFFSLNQHISYNFLTWKTIIYKEDKGISRI